MKKTKWKEREVQKIKKIISIMNCTINKMAEFCDPIMSQNTTHSFQCKDPGYSKSKPPSHFHS